MMGIIELYKGHEWHTDCWIADYSKSSDAKHVMRVMGTYCVPTAYSAQADASVVQATIQDLNPGFQVVVRGA